MGPRMLAKVTIEIPEAPKGSVWTIHPEFLAGIVKLLEKRENTYAQDMTMEYVEQVLLVLIGERSPR